MTQQGSVNLSRPSHIAWGGGHFVAVGGGNIVFSRDAQSWNVSSNGYLYVGSSVAFGNGTFIAVGSSNPVRILQSDPFLKIEASGLAMLKIFGPIGTACSIEKSENLATNSWQAVTNFNLTASPLLWNDPTPTNLQ